MKAVVVILSLWCCLSLPNVVHGNQKVFSEYAKLKVLKSCLGNDAMLGFTKRIQSALVTCNNIPVQVGDMFSSVPSYNPHGNEPLKTPASSVPKYDVHEAPTKYHSKQGINPFSKPPKELHFGNRQKREVNVFYPEFLVRNLKDRVVSHLSNLTCILERLDYIKHGYTANYQFMIREINSLGLNNRLQSDLIQGIEYCKRMTMCLPITESTTAIPVDLKRTLMFLKCTDQQQFLSCMRNDLLNEKYRFDLKGLDGILKHLDPADQMLAIVWSDIELNSKHEFDFVL